MINILPVYERMQFRKAYRFRVAALGFFMLAVALLAALVLLVPAYIITDIRRQTVLDRLSTIDTNELNTKVSSLNDIIADINTRLTLFTDPEEATLISRDALLPVLSHVRSDLLVNSFSAEQNSEGGLTIKVGGIAKNRDALLTFERALRATPSFSGVDVPISNFVRGSDILFTITFSKN